MLNCKKALLLEKEGSDRTWKHVFFVKREDQAKHNAKSLYSKVYLLVV